MNSLFDAITFHMAKKNIEGLDSAFFFPVRYWIIFSIFP